MTEEQFQRATAELLRMLGWFAFHTPNERANATQRAILSGLGVVPGIPDWLILEMWSCGGATGFGVAIELKRGRNQLTEAQRRVRERLERRGFLYSVCRDLEEFGAALERVDPLNGRRFSTLQT